MNNKTKYYVGRYGWHLDVIASHTYVRRGEKRWVRRRRVDELSNPSTGGITVTTANVMFIEGLVKFDGRILRVTVKGKGVVDEFRKIAAAKQRKMHLKRQGVQ